MLSIIIETEAYAGPGDRASRAFGGRHTHGIRALYSHPGAVYVYLVYGMHWLLNLKAAHPDQPQAVLIRGISTRVGSNLKIIAGPGKISKYLKVGRSFYGEDVATSSRIWIEDIGLRISPRQVVKGPRVGIDYAGSYWASKPWRFRIKLGASSTPPHQFAHRRP
jgi:DNA-3-methyladenine glycosylase